MVFLIGLKKDKWVDKLYEYTKDNSWGAFADKPAQLEQQEFNKDELKLVHKKMSYQYGRP